MQIPQQRHIQQALVNKKKQVSVDVDSGNNNNRPRMGWIRWIWCKPQDMCSTSTVPHHHSKPTNTSLSSMQKKKEIQKKSDTGTMGSSKQSNGTIITKIDTSVTFLRLARERRFDEIIDMITYLQNCNSMNHHPNSRDNNVWNIDQKSSTSTSSSVTSSSSSNPSTSLTGSVLYDWLQVHSETRSSTCECLHLLCMYRPTPKVVQLVQKVIEQQAHHHNSTKVAATAVRNTDSNVDTERTMTRTTSFSDMMIVNSTLVTDAMGRTPLHIAVACGCSYLVIDVLLLEDHEAVYMMDRTNRYPLHWACCEQPQQQQVHSMGDENSTISSKAQRSEKEIVNTIKIINKLMSIYAMAVISKDDTGCTPMDLAIANHADRRIIYALQYIPTPIGTVRESPRRRYPALDSNRSVAKSFASSKVSNSNAPVRYIDPEEIDYEDTDDMSSIGSRGVSKNRRKQNRHYKHEFVLI